MKKPTNTYMSLKEIAELSNQQTTHLAAPQELTGTLTGITLTNEQKLTHPYTEPLNPKYQRHGVTKDSLTRIPNKHPDIPTWANLHAPHEKALLIIMRHLTTRPTNPLNPAQAHQQVRQELTQEDHPAMHSNPMTLKSLMDHHQLQTTQRTSKREQAWTKQSAYAKLASDYTKQRHKRQKNAKPKELTKPPQAHSTTSSGETSQ